MTKGLLMTRLVDFWFELKLKLVLGFCNFLSRAFEIDHNHKWYDLKDGRESCWYCLKERKVRN